MFLTQFCLSLAWVLIPRTISSSYSLCHPLKMFSHGSTELAEYRLVFISNEDMLGPEHRIKTDFILFGCVSFQFIQNGTFRETVFPKTVFLNISFLQKYRKRAHIFF